MVSAVKQLISGPKKADTSALDRQAAAAEAEKKKVEAQELQKGKEEVERRKRRGSRRTPTLFGGETGITPTSADKRQTIG